MSRISPQEKPLQVDFNALTARCLLKGDHHGCFVSIMGA